MPRRLLLLPFIMLLSCMPAARPVAAQGLPDGSDLPLVLIDASGPIVNEPKVMARLRVIDNGPGNRNRPADAALGYDGPAGVEFRGSSSQWFPKKSYAVETRDATGADSSIALLGLPRESDWILHGPYSDKSLMRNALVMHLSNRIGRYASRTRYVELLVNGSYEGLYVLMEKIKRDGDRVDVARMTADDVAGDAVTGGYILKIDKSDGAEVAGWRSDFPPAPGSADRVFIQYHYPKPSDITAEQAQWVQQAFTAFESRMASASWDLPGVGYESLVDVPSAVDFMLLNEIAKNIDGYRLSTFFHIDRQTPERPDPKWTFGPIWDFNLGFGNANYYAGESVIGFQVHFRPPDGDFQPPFWFRKWWGDPDFHAQVRARWTSLRQGAFATDSIMAWIDETGLLLDESQRRDADRWGHIGTHVWPNPVVWQTRDQEIAYLKDWLSRRLTWLDSQLRNAVTVEEGPRKAVELSVWPNPVQTGARLRIEGARGGRVHVVDVMGRSRSEPLDGSSMATDTWAPGLYFIVDPAGTGKRSRPVIVVR